MTQAEGWELQAIASTVIGGSSLFGAVGSVHGPLIGAFILATINNGANLLNVNSFWQRIITGGLIIIIVYFDQPRRRRPLIRRISSQRAQRVQDHGDVDHLLQQRAPADRR